MLKVFPNHSVITVEDGERAKIPCTVEAGLRAQVFWRFQGEALSLIGSGEGSGEASIYVTASERQMQNHTVEYQRLLHITAMTGRHAGVYSCVVVDPGHPGRSVYEVFSVSVHHFVSSPATLPSPVAADNISPTGNRM